MKSERGFLKTAKVVLIAVVSWFVLTISSELIGSQATETALGQVIGRSVLLAAVFLVPVAVVVWLVLYLRDRRDDEPDEESEEDSAAPDPDWPAPLEPPRWQQPDPLYGRDSEVDRALAAVRRDGLVVLAGPRDTGTSAVAVTVVQRLIDAQPPDAARATRFDLRSQSSQSPDDARVAARRVVSAFGEDEPADGTPALLADAAHRLVAALRANYDVLMLDNASTPEEIEWLVRHWPPDGPPWLVIAGESAIARVINRDPVLVGELDRDGLRAMWRAEVPEPTTTRGRRIWDRLTRRADAGEADLNALLDACCGRPGVLKAFIREILRPDSTVTITSLVTAARSPDSPDGALDRVWTQMLDHAREGLSPDGVWLLHALAELPVTGLTTDAIEAMLADHGATSPALEELRIRNLVQETAGRYRLPLEFRGPLARTTPEEIRHRHAREAVPALLRYYATNVADWADRLGFDAHAGTRLKDAELSLLPLFSKDSYTDDHLLTLSIDPLATIAAALEVWYIRDRHPGSLLAVNTALHALADRAARPDVAGPAAVRMATAHRMSGHPGEAGRLLDVAAACTIGLSHDKIADIAVAEQIERALLSLSTSDSDTLTRAKAGLARILAAHGDHRGTTAALINLGALCLRQNRPTEALRHLRRAERLANDRLDTGCRAQAIELQGIALSQQDGKLLDAVAAWRLAEHYFRTIGEKQGEARCLQHLGSAALVDSRVAGQIRDNQPVALEDEAAVNVAVGLLKRAKELLGGRGSTSLVEDYLREGRERGERGAIVAGS